MILEQTGELAPKDRPWQLIRDAIHDLTLQEQTLSVVIDMAHWHNPRLFLDDRVRVCYQSLAGAVMSRRLGVDPGASTSPEDFQEDVKSRLYALAYFCIGCVTGAAKKLGLEPAYIKRLEDQKVTPYGEDPEQFRRDMLDLADYLEERYR